MAQRFRTGVGAVLLLLILVVAFVPAVLADGHVASDGQTLADQPQDVQDLYASVYGDEAAGQWAIEHDREIGFVRDAADDAPIGDAQDYAAVYAAALERSGDAELSHRITRDVLGRGTVAAFLDGNDPGVLYGLSTVPVVRDPVPASSPASSPAASPAPSARCHGHGPLCRMFPWQDNLRLTIWWMWRLRGRSLPRANSACHIPP